MGWVELEMNRMLVRDEFQERDRVESPPMPRCFIIDNVDKGKSEVANWQWVQKIILGNSLDCSNVGHRLAEEIKAMVDGRDGGIIGTDPTRNDWDAEIKYRLMMVPLAALEALPQAYPLRERLIDEKRMLMQVQMDIEALYHVHVHPV